MNRQTTVKEAPKMQKQWPLFLETTAVTWENNRHCFLRLITNDKSVYLFKGKKIIYQILFQKYKSKNKKMQYSL